MCIVIRHKKCILYTKKGKAEMKDEKLVRRAWAQLLLELDGIRREGELALEKLEDLDAKRRIDGAVIEGSIAEYCRCGKRDCSAIGTPGHTIRYHLQTADGARHIPKKRIEEYRTALAYNKQYRRAMHEIKRYRQTCEKCYKALGRVSRRRSFDSYLLSFI